VTMITGPDNTSRKLRCLWVEGKRANRIYEERINPSETFKVLARRIYTDFVGDRLQDSVGGLHQEMFVCVEGCPEGQMSVAIRITCAECGMDEEFCDERQNPRPKLATVSADEINLRAGPSLNVRLSEICVPTRLFVYWKRNLNALSLMDTLSVAGSRSRQTAVRNPSRAGSLIRRSNMALRSNAVQAGLANRITPSNSFFISSMPARRTRLRARPSGRRPRRYRKSVP
jgi:hypothetical protein